MGTNTDFTGAIRITPCVEEPLATRLKQFMDIRHMKRNVKTLHTLFPDLEDRKPMSLFGDGDFGEEGAFFIPVGRLISIEDFMRPAHIRKDSTINSA